MDRQKKTDAELKPVAPKREQGTSTFYTGTEAFFGVFTQTQVVMNGVRLVHNEKVTQQVSDLASQIENIRRRFLHSGDVNFALQECVRITNSFNQRVQAWEAEASRRERNKASMSGHALAKMKSEFSMVRTKIRLASRTLTKLEIELHQIAGRELFESNEQQRSNEASNDQPAQSQTTAPKAPVEQQTSALSLEEQAKAAEYVREVNLLLHQLVGESLLVSYENADREVPGDPDRMEQVWDAPAAAEIPVLLVGGWTVKHPNLVDGQGLERKKLDLCFWLVPKSLNASKALRWVDGNTNLWIRSRKLDSAKITFGIATENEFPKSELIAGFLEKFANKYGNQSPTLLVAHFRNLEWTQKTVIVSCSEKQG